MKTESSFVTPYSYEAIYPNCYHFLDSKGFCIGIAIEDNYWIFKKFLEAIQNLNYPKGVFNSPDDIASYYIAIFRQNVLDGNTTPFEVFSKA